jgi:hypothetical protein
MASFAPKPRAVVTGVTILLLSAVGGVLSRIYDDQGASGAVLFAIALGVLLSLGYYLYWNGKLARDERKGGSGAPSADANTALATVSMVLAATMEDQRQERRARVTPEESAQAMVFNPALAKAVANDASATTGPVQTLGGPTSGREYVEMLQARIKFLEMQIKKAQGIIADRETEKARFTPVYEELLRVHKLARELVAKTRPDMQEAYDWRLGYREFKVAVGHLATLLPKHDADALLLAAEAKRVSVTTTAIDPDEDVKATAEVLWRLCEKYSRLTSDS